MKPKVKKSKVHVYIIHWCFLSGGQTPSSPHPKFRSIVAIISHHSELTSRHWLLIKCGSGVSDFFEKFVYCALKRKQMVGVLSYFHCWKIKITVNLLAKRFKTQQVRRPLAFFTPLETECEDDVSLVWGSIFLYLNLCVSALVNIAAHCSWKCQNFWNPRGSCVCV